MGAFEHILVLLSFVYALAIGHLLTTAALLIRGARSVRFSALHGFWMLNAVTVILANWISFWDLRNLPSWSVASIFFTFAMAFANYLQAALVCPEVVSGEPLDLVAFQEAQRLRIVGSFEVSGVFAFVANAVYGAVFGVVSWGAENAAVGIMALGGAVALVWRARWAQIVAAATIAGAWAYYFSSLQPAIR